MPQPRVVITGLGAITPLGLTVDQYCILENAGFYHLSVHLRTLSGTLPNPGKY